MSYHNKYNRYLNNKKSFERRIYSTKEGALASGLPRMAYMHCRYILQAPCPELEPLILKNVIYASNYFYNVRNHELQYGPNPVIAKPWPEFEKLILKQKRTWYKQTYIIRVLKRMSEQELNEYLKDHPEWITELI